MTRKLNETDRQAVDLVMDRFASQRGADSVGTMTEAPSEPNVHAVERILAVLAQMPAMDPPADLLSRTERRIDQSSPQVMEIPPYLGPGQLPA
jgi:hypothetical protein